MAEPIVLNEEEQKLYDELQELLEASHQFYSDHSSDYSEQGKRYDQMKKAAHDLHFMLKGDNHEPKHHSYMYKNRGVPVEDVEFYNHIHPVEDLIAFINDPDANNDPEDTTMGIEFNIRIYTNRWGHYDGYFLTRTVSGWTIQGASVFNSNTGDKSGSPALFAALDHDFVCYPKQTGDLLEHIWEKAQQGATQEQVQKYLNDFAEWISTCEKATPAVWYED